ncbi:hypothetical protein H5410_060847 [Solanum commersonii]|uniref:Retrotransposon gag domain-containing protein n=1 Tax=Solanum commersonii TaxID=4109 RepID=A0A9J5W6J9_SOLCO|nr:hypothetical protein H5410_060847 [Solanum commersonii]
MPPQRVVRGHPSRRNIEEQGVPNAPKVQPQGKVVFDSAFMGSFIPRELKKAKIREFFTIKWESMSVDKYILKFIQLSRYASEMVADMRAGCVCSLQGCLVYQVEKDKLRDRKEFRNKKAKTSGNESRQQKSNAN